MEQRERLKEPCLGWICGLTQDSQLIEFPGIPRLWKWRFQPHLPRQTGAAQPCCSQGFSLCREGQRAPEKRGADSFPSVVRCPGLLRIRSHRSFNNSLSFPSHSWAAGTDSRGSNGIPLLPLRERMQQSQASPMTNTHQKGKLDGYSRNWGSKCPLHVRKLSSWAQTWNPSPLQGKLEALWPFVPFFFPSLVESEIWIYVYHLLHVNPCKNLPLRIIFSTGCKMKRLKCAVFDWIRTNILGEFSNKSWYWDFLFFPRQVPTSFQWQVLSP